MSRPWDERHRREALRRLYEIAAAVAGGAARPIVDPCAIVGGAVGHHETEAEWRSHLAWVFGFDGGAWPARVDREVRRVRRLAEGLDVRETSERWHVRLRDPRGTHTSSAMTKAMARREAATVTNPSVRATVVRVLVTRIRKAGAS